LTKSLYITITLCLLLAPKLGLSSEVEFYGKVRDQKTNKALEQSVLEIKLEDGLYKKIECGKNGRFDIDLEFNLRYDVYFICKGYETKWIVLDLRRVPAEDQEGGFKFPVEISLFKKRKNFDNSCLEKPIGILRYSSEKNVLDWDFNHTSRLAVELDKANLLADSLNLSKFEKLVKIQYQPLTSRLVLYTLIK